MPDIVLAMTGASGSIYGIRLLELLRASDCRVHLTISPAATRVFSEELGLKINLDQFELDQILPEDLSQSGSSGHYQEAVSAPHGSSIFSDSGVQKGMVCYHHFQDWGAPIASGSFRTDAMVICPCSMGTLASLANGLSSNLIHRAGHVHLKERRKLVVVPRETPLGTIQLDNMKRLSEAGAVVLPASPGFYHEPVTIHDLVDFVVTRILDQIGLDSDLMKRWGNDA